MCCHCGRLHFCSQMKCLQAWLTGRYQISPQNSWLATYTKLKIHSRFFDPISKTSVFFFRNLVINWFNNPKSNGPRTMFVCSLVFFQLFVSSLLCHSIVLSVVITLLSGMLDFDWSVTKFHKVCYSQNMEIYKTGSSRYFELSWPSVD